MVPVEAVSLSIAVATLFTACIECFEYFQAAKGFEQHFEVLLVKLEYQQERLPSVGPISNSDHKYDLQTYNSTSDAAAHSGISTNALKRFRLRLGHQSQGPSVLDKTRWAIHDATKFQKLVEDIRDLIDGLTETIPVSSDLQDQKVQDDIASMVDDIQSLHLFQEACKDDYPEWWTAASAAIDASEVATLDNRLADERLEHYGASNPGTRGVEVDESMGPVHYGDPYGSDTKRQLFFVLTGSCNAQDSETPGDQSSLGTMSFQSKHSFIALGSGRSRSTPGYRITKYIDLTRFVNADINKYIESRDQILALKIAAGEDAPEVDSRYRVIIYLYCPPCACQVATALKTCQERNQKEFVDVSIRIDHRQKTCCSASASRIEGIISIVKHLKEMAKSTLLSDYAVQQLKAIDREWLERQIYEYAEEDRVVKLPPASQLALITEAHKSEEACAAIILLGEADYCIPLLGAPPLRPFEPGRMPRETQMFRCFQ